MAALCVLLLAVGCARPQPAILDRADRLTRTYACGALGDVVVRYGNSSSGRPTVRLTIGGKTRDLARVIAASGTRYATERGLRPDWGLIWWTKGPAEATLLEMLLDHTATPDDAHSLATCRAVSR